MTPIPDEPTPTPTPDANFPRTLRADDDPEFFTPDTLMPDDGPVAIDRRRVSIEIVPGYELIEELGRGGMGIVYKARQIGLNRVVALKMILAGSHALPEERQRFRQEAEAIARLQHPNIVGVYEVSEYQGQPYFSLEFCGGGSLADKLTGTPLPPTEAARLLLPLARGIQHAHDHGIVHRDLKPANILIQKELNHRDTETQRRQEQRTREEEKNSTNSSSSLWASVSPWFNSVKITDFGLAKRLDDVSRTRDGDVMGTPSYMAPEQAAGKVTQIGPHSDTYALGAILYELLTGRPPFVAASPMETVFQVITRDPIPVRALQPKVPRDLETIALKCIQKEPSRRYASAAALAEDLQRYLDGRPILARPVGPFERGWRWARRYPAQAALAGFVVTATVVFVAGLMWFTQRLSVEKRLANDKAAEAEEARGVAVVEQRKAEKNEKLAKHNETVAEQRFLKALEVADRYFTEVSESTLLHEPGMDLLRQRLLKKARDFYADFVHERRDDARLDGELARSVYRLGLIDAELSEYDGAARQLNDARARFDLLLKTPSADGRLYETRAKLLNDLGRVERHRGHHGLALAAYEKALEAWQRLDRDTSGSRAAKEGLGRCLLGLGNVMRNLDHREKALELYQRSLDYRRSLVEADKNDENYRRDLALTWQSLAGVLSLLGRADEAAEACRHSLTTFRELVQAYPTRGRYRDDLGAELYNEGHRLMQDKRYGPAADSYGEAMQHFEYLVLRHPAKPLYLSRLGHSLWNRAVCLDKAGQRGPAETEYTKARLVRHQLATAQPDVPEFQVAYAQCLRRDGDRALESKETTRAAEAYRQAREVMEKAPPTPECRLLLAVLLLKSSKVTPDKGQAAKFLDQAFMEVRALARQRQLVERAVQVERDILAERAKLARP